LYDRFDDPEGYLTALRSSLVNYRTIGEVGQEIGLPNLIYLSRAEKEELGQARLSIVADCVEAVLGAMYLDGNYQVCKNFIEDKILIKLDDIIEAQSWKDAKTKLQEWTQKHLKVTPQYHILASEGKDHNKTFVAGVVVNDEMMAKGSGGSKQDAETNAAQMALEKMQEEVE
jgi:ribonuclease-3